MFDNLVILSMYAIALIAAFCLAETIVILANEWVESRLQYGNTKVGHILKPRNRVKKSKFNITMRNILAKLGFN